MLGFLFPKAPIGGSVLLDYLHPVLVRLQVYVSAAKPQIIQFSCKRAGDHGIY